MKAYPEYKASGIDWLGEIPSHWDIISLKYLCDICTGNKDTINRVDDGLHPFFVRSPKVERINSYSYDGEAILMAGDGVGAGKVFHYINGKFDYHQRVYNFHNFDKVSGKFLFYYLQSNFKYVIEEGAAKSTVDSVRLPWLKSFPIALPDIDTQKKIVSFLDKKSPQIDALVAGKQAQVEDLRKYRTSLITEAVTRGLNPNAPLRQSGIDLIGDIPQTWECIPLKFLLHEQLMYGANETAEDEINFNHPRYIRITDISENGKLKSETYRTLSPIKAEPYMLKSGDVLFARSGATAGKTYLYNETYPACFAGYLIKASCGNKLLPTFLCYFTNTQPYINWKSSIFDQSTIQNISAEKYNGLPIPLPTMGEQQQIVKYLDEKTAKIDALIDELNQQLDELALYRKAVISEAVTGKVDVRDWKPED